MPEPVAEHDYIGFSELPTMEASDKTKTRDDSVGLNLKATELKLGLPGSESPERVDPRLLSLKSCCSISGAKRVFSDAINGTEKWVFSSGSTGADAAPLGPGSGHGGSAARDGKATQLAKPDSPVQEKKGPASKAQVVGWPPVRSFRKNTLASQSQKNNGENPESESCLYVKVSMEGAPYLRKIDLKTFKSYLDLSSALEKMFNCFKIGQFGSSNGGSSSHESRLSDLLRGSEYVVTYEDKDGDWMLVGDVPWQMFIDSCKRLRMVKSKEAIGLSPRSVEKSRS
ncbi:PREDICTED: auxin-responsive protein IAA27-like [Tarenaya hassleriana]|uniref:auxin-responsive protein IAA27-like n=1 Tax=Tarenaya hassleriana TaxID=28532 RepID=UPI00053CA65A|nr:PREDICTED: auxin-responsive protein IAA27-like [Tarenaya hassleriana]